MLEIRMLGPLELRAEDSRLELPALKPRLALICLASSPGFVASVGELSRAVWGEEPPSGSLNSLHVYISTLRKRLGAESLIGRGRTYSLAHSTVVDLERFKHEVESGTAALARNDDVAAAAWLARGLARWSGPPLSTEGDSDFVVSLRSAAIETWLRALEAWSDVRTRMGSAAEVVSRLAEPVEQHPYREVLRARYIMALGASGRQAEALAEYASARTSIRTELGVEPSQFLADAQTAVLRGEFPEIGTVFQPTIRMGLSSTFGPLIGRESELASLERLASNPTVRLATVLGHGGIGKTRLVQEYVVQHPDTSVFVSLASAEPGDDLVGRICVELGIGASSDPLEAVAGALSSNLAEVVLVLDNLEHLPAAPDAITQIIGRAPLVTVLTTSRIPLRVAGERRLTLDPLDVKSSNGALSPAAEMLLDRVWAYNEALVPSEAELADAVSIAQLCEGVPLSLEMIAARALVFSLSELRSRLERSILSLVSASDGEFGTASTGAVIRWSVSLLPPGTKAAFIVASEFRGGFTTLTLAGLLGCEPDAAAESMRVMVEYALVAASSVEGSRRFHMLEVVRAVARSDLTAAEVADLQHRHATYFRSSLHNQNPDLFFPSKISELEVIGVESANYRHAVRNALQSDLSLAMELIDGLGVPWMRVGSPDELADWIGVLLGNAELSAEARMACLIHLLRVDQLRANVDADTLFLRLRAIASDVSDPNLLASYYAYQTIYASDRADTTAAAEAVARLEKLPDSQKVRYWLSTARVSLLIAAEDDQGAVAELTTFLEWAKPEGIELNVRSSTQNLIYSLMSCRRYSEAADLAMEQLTVVSAADVASRIALLMESGEALMWLGQGDSAITNLQLAAELALSFGSDRYIGDVTLRLSAARLMVESDDPDGAFLAGVALAWTEQSAVQLDHAERHLVTTFLDPVRRAESDSPLGVQRVAGERAFATSGLLAVGER